MPSRRTTPVGLAAARRLRRAPTAAESRLWAYLRAGQLLGVGFRRQHAIGKYVVDFCSPRHHLVIELDGSGHIAQEPKDSERTRALESMGYRVMRFWNNDVLNDIQGVVSAILQALHLTD
jgi:very-short-patch-repair endonuclease